jgi:hypothetical protein
MLPAKTAATKEQRTFQARVMKRLRDGGMSSPDVAVFFEVSDATVRRLATMPVKTREENFEGNFMPEPNSGCWLWTGYVDADGYGKFGGLRAHRFSYETHISKIPNGFVIDHLCRVRCCVNPQHLRAVTNTQNVLCGVGVTARRALQTHCVHGHSLDGCYVTKKGYRQCRECHKNRQAIQNAKRRK